MKLLLAQNVLLAAGALASPVLERTSSACTSPKVQLKNGTLTGVYSPEYHQDFFLGVPFAQPPVGDLRFRNPRPLNQSWAGERPAKALTASCVGYGASQWGYNVSEDCLYMNVIRPAAKKEPLPVLVWIHGGAWVQGSGMDLRYNLSFIVERSVQLGQPLIAVGINYRLSAWGFLSSQEVFDGGDSNFGLRDQRLSLEWLQENIRAFGGDPKKVTIWGQSAGAMAVGRQLNAFNGRDDGLFRAAAMFSGSSIPDDADAASTQATYDRLVAKAGCNGTAADAALACLRALPFDDLNAAVNSTGLTSWSPKIDGDFIARRAYDQMREGAVVKVPIIQGATTDEGTSFGTKGINTTEQFRGILPSSWNNSFRDAIVAAYPERSAENILPNLPLNYTPPAYPWGEQWVRAATFAGDNQFVARRRASCEAWAAMGLPAYCVRFNAIPAWSGPLDGATHFVDVAFAMLNLEGVGYAPVRTPPFQGLGEEFRDLARLMASDLIAFTVSGEPNKWRGRELAAKTKKEKVPRWPLYSTTTGKPEIFLYDANITSSTEDDTFRKAGIDILKGLYV